MSKKLTQGRRLISALKQRAHTYGEMQRLGISTSPQKRIMECLLPHEQVLKSHNVAGLTTWRVIAATKWTA